MDKFVTRKPKEGNIQEGIKRLQQMHDDVSDNQARLI